MPKRALERFVLALVLALPVALGACTSDEPTIDWRIASTSPTAGWKPMTLAAGDSTFYVSDSSIISDADIAELTSSKTDNGLLLAIQLTPEGASRLEQATSSHINDRLAVIVASRFVNAPVIASPVGSGGQLTVALPLSGEASKEVAAALGARWPKT